MKNKKVMDFTGHDIMTTNLEGTAIYMNSDLREYVLQISSDYELSEDPHQAFFDGFATCYLQQNKDLKEQMIPHIQVICNSNKGSEVSNAIKQLKKIYTTAQDDLLHNKWL